jgi:hypothetical protein
MPTAHSITRLPVTEDSLRFPILLTPLGADLATEENTWCEFKRPDAPKSEKVR